MMDVKLARDTPHKTLINIQRCFCLCFDSRSTLYLQTFFLFTNSAVFCYFGSDEMCKKVLLLFRVYLQTNKRLLTILEILDVRH